MKVKPKADPVAKKLLFTSKPSHYENFNRSNQKSLVNIDFSSVDMAQLGTPQKYQTKQKLLFDCILDDSTKNKTSSAFFEDCEMSENE